MSKYHEANRKGWDAVSPGWQAKVERNKDWSSAPHKPENFLNPIEMKFLAGISGKEACVLGSGDNLIVFALCGLGARVTSVDISQTQLDIAADRAGQLGLEIEFHRLDVTNLASILDETFDLIYTGGHVAVWVDDLKKYYAEAARILRPGGLFLINECHPFRRPWKEIPERLELEFNYYDRGPAQYDRSEDVPDAEPGSLPSYEFRWTVSDFVQAVLEAGCELICFEEFGDKQPDWTVTPLAGLPGSLILVGKKRS
ncbi:MAG: class I SAM-dependent methyltransferase [Planctomycetota bacterium]|nr:class I SAM-dependent methyltransferase [Planctomycetota bacterium]